MKSNMNYIFFLTFVITKLITSTCSSFLNLEELLNSDTSSNSLDTDEMVFKMKEYIDAYTEKLKQSTKTVDKLLIPPNNSNENIGVIYIDYFDLESLKREVDKFIDDTKNDLESTLKTNRDSKRKEEEKNIDLITRNKIINSRMNVGNVEKNKLTNDYSDKLNHKTTQDNELKQIKEKSENLADSNLEKMKTIQKLLEKYSKNFKKMDLNEKVFEDEFDIQNNLEDVKSKLFEANFEFQFYKNLNGTRNDYINKTKVIEELFSNSILNLQSKIMDTKSNIQNNTELLRAKKNQIREKLDTFQNYNESISKLKVIQNDYIKVQKELEESLNFMKSKKKIIEENILEKKRQRNLRKATVEKTLKDLEKELEKYNIDKIGVNKIRNEITEINKRTRNLLIKENMIFKKNKIKL